MNEELTKTVGAAFGKKDAAEKEIRDVILKSNEPSFFKAEQKDKKSGARRTLFVKYPQYPTGQTAEAISLSLKKQRGRLVKSASVFWARRGEFAVPRLDLKSGKWSFGRGALNEMETVSLEQSNRSEYENAFDEYCEITDFLKND